MAQRIQEPGGEIAFEVAVDLVLGTSPSLTVEVEWSLDEGATWAKAEPPDTFAAITAARRVVKDFDPKATWYRIVWTISGAVASFTFGVREQVGW